MSSREFDLTVFGISGSFGRQIFRYMIQWWIEDGKQKKIAVAGNVREDLVKIVRKTASEFNVNLDSVGIIFADCFNNQSLISMCQRSRLIINAVGPYDIYGEPVIRACLKTKTHMIDGTGEPQYAEGMMLKYHEEAKKLGIYFVSGCGWVSNPPEIGLNILRDKFGPSLIKSAVGYSAWKNGPHGKAIGYGSLRSIAGMMDNLERIESTRETLYKTTAIFEKIMPPIDESESHGSLPWKHGELGWCMPIISENTGFAHCSMAWYHETREEKPFQYFEYLVYPQFWRAFFMTIGFKLLLLLLFLLPSRLLMLKFPDLLTLGFFKKYGPSQEQLDECSVTFTIIGKGWRSKKDMSQPPNKTVTVAISGPEPLFLISSRCMLHSALTILEEKDKMPFSGGFYSPGFAFNQTSLISRLKKCGIKFDVFDENYNSC
ncbi:saccharopine dehydrogenase-like oxidoreductase [Brevipalpus obovatus]|uniref:saccharopine dehydrogenase-like oxidoreductase n=1 Tax=Brevipalpus obovatus TaxID=246614 RepID=UPI003D9E5FB8